MRPPRRSSFTTRVGTVNAFVELTKEQAFALINRVVRLERPGLLGVNEWDHSAPELPDNYAFARPRGGGNPVVWNTDRYEHRYLTKEVLAKRGFTGVLPGRKSIMPESSATVAVFTDLLTAAIVTLIVFHLTSEIQKGTGYRKDPAHWLRVLRHKKERRRLRRLIRQEQAKGREVYAVGDTNFDRMPLQPLISCWRGHPIKEAGGTLGNRAVDIVYGPEESSWVRTLATASDHDMVLAVYTL